MGKRGRQSAGESTFGDEAPKSKKRMDERTLKGTSLEGWVQRKSSYDEFQSANSDSDGKYRSDDEKSNKALPSIKDAKRQKAGERRREGNKSDVQKPLTKCASKGMRKVRRSSLQQVESPQSSKKFVSSATPSNREKKDTPTTAEVDTRTTKASDATTLSVSDPANTVALSVALKDPNDADVESDVDSDDETVKAKKFHHKRRPSAKMEFVPVVTAVELLHQKKTKNATQRPVLYNFSKTRAQLRDVSGATSCELTHGATYRHQRNLLHQIVKNHFSVKENDLVDILFKYGGYGAGIIYVEINIFRAERLEHHRRLALDRPDSVPADVVRDLWLLCMSRKAHSGFSKSKERSDNESEKSQESEEEQKPLIGENGRVVRQCRLSIKKHAAVKAKASRTEAEPTKEINPDKTPQLKQAKADERKTYHKSEAESNAKQQNKVKNGSRPVRKAPSKDVDGSATDNSVESVTDINSESFDENQKSSSEDSDNHDSDALTENTASEVERSDDNISDVIDSDSNKKDLKSKRHPSTRRKNLKKSSESSKKQKLSAPINESSKSAIVLLDDSKENEKDTKKAHRYCSELLQITSSREDLIKKALAGCQQQPDGRERRLTLVDNAQTRRLREEVSANSIGVKYDDFYDPISGSLLWFSQSCDRTSNVCLSIVEQFTNQTADIFLAAKSADTQNRWTVLGSPVDVRLQSPASLKIKRGDSVVRTTKKGTTNGHLKVHIPTSSSKPRPLCSEVVGKTFTGMSCAWDIYDGLEQRDLEARRRQSVVTTTNSKGRKSLRSAPTDSHLNEHRMVTATKESKFTPSDCCIYCGWEPAALWFIIGPKDQSILEAVFLGKHSIPESAIIPYNNDLPHKKGKRKSLEDSEKLEHQKRQQNTLTGWLSNRRSMKGNERE